MNTFHIDPANEKITLVLEAARELLEMPDGDYAIRAETINGTDHLYTVSEKPQGDKTLLWGYVDKENWLSIALPRIRLETGIIL